MANEDIEPAVEGVHWRKVLEPSGRERCICLKCDPMSTGIGYCDIGSLNRHLRANHNKRAFSTTTRRRRGGPKAAGLQTRAKKAGRPSRAGRPSNGRRSTPTRKSKERAATAKGPARVTRKRAAADNEAFVADKTRAAKGGATANGIPARPVEECEGLGGGNHEEWDPSLKEAPTLLPPDHYITIPSGGLSSIAFKSEATAYSITQTLEAQWFELSAHCEAEKCHAKECNVNDDGRRKGKSKAPNLKSIADGNAGCMDRLSRAPFAKFPIFCFNYKEEVVRNPTSKSPTGTGQCNEVDTEENRADMLKWALRPMDELNKGEGQVPLVNYSSDDSDGLD